MASEFADPPAPQSQVITDSGPNKSPRRDAYTDPALTKRNAQSSVPAAPTLVENLGSNRAMYASDDLDEIAQTATNPGVAPAPHSPNSWKPGRDPYANSGYDGYNQNQG